MPVSLALASLLCSAVLAADASSPLRTRRGSTKRSESLSVTSPGMWTWANGPDRVAEHERIGIYGTKGVAAPENVPGARREAVTWRDASGSLWLFGGYGFAGRASQNTLNDLWKWDGTAWTWVGGSNQNQYLATYGTKGVPAPENNPGGRYGAASWIDASGNLWLFGGGSQIESQALGDLWRWDGANWTWMSGANVPSQPGIYGTKGVAAP